MTAPKSTGASPEKRGSARRPSKTRQPRLVYGSAPDTAYTDQRVDARSRRDVAESIEAIRETFSRHSAPEGVAVVEGRGCMVHVDRGRLHLSDGLGAHRRNRTYEKATHGLRRIVVAGPDALMSTAALRWCAAAGIYVVVLGADSALLAAGPPGRDDARLLRSQALALYGPSGVEVTRYLITEKLLGQARVLGLHLWEDATVSTIVDLCDAVGDAGSIEEIRQAEAAAANVYFAAWERSVSVNFTRKDLPRLPEHWAAFNGRRSSVHPGSPRSATDPAGALLNYAYKLAEIEAALAARRIGLDPTLGILHADAAGRAGLACDLMEAVRPMVDAHVLGVLNGPLRKRDFFEDGRGVVRCLAPITHRLAEAMPSYAVALAPVTEKVAGILAEASPYDVNVPTVLSGAKHKAAARRRVDAEREAVAPHPAAGVVTNSGAMRPQRRRRTKPSASAPLPLRICRGCGGQLAIEHKHGYARPRTEWCPSCVVERREEIGSSLPDAARIAAERFAERTGVLPTHTAEAQAARSTSNTAQRIAEIAYEAAQSPAFDRDWFGTTVQPLLADFTLPAIAKVTGVSTAAAAKWRASRRVPHPRHWVALVDLVGVEWPEEMQR